MDILDAMVFAKKLRGIARRADTFGYDRDRILEELIFTADNYEDFAERIEAAMLRDAST